MKYYKYNSKGVYAYTGQAQKDPIQSKIDNKDVFLLPPSSTFVEPPKVENGYYLQWTGSDWRQYKFYSNKEDIEKLKSDKILELKSERARQENEPLTSDNMTFDFDAKSRQRLLVAMESLGGDKVASIDWTLANNTVTTLRLDNIVKLFKAASDRNLSLQKKYKELKAKVNACTTADEVKAIVWKFYVVQ